MTIVDDILKLYFYKVKVLLSLFLQFFYITFSLDSLLIENNIKMLSILINLLYLSYYK